MSVGEAAECMTEHPLTLLEDESIVDAMARLRHA
jgi:hypothetical protein